MKYKGTMLTTLTKRIKYEVEFFADSEKQAYELIAKMPDDKFDKVETYKDTLVVDHIAVEEAN